MNEQEVLIDIRERLIRLETKFENQNGLKEEVESLKSRMTEEEARSKSNTHRLNQLEANYTWLWRTVVGAIIAGIIGAMMK